MLRTEHDSDVCGTRGCCWRAAGIVPQLCTPAPRLPCLRGSAHPVSGVVCASVPLRPGDWSSGTGAVIIGSRDTACVQHCLPRGTRSQSFFLRCLFDKEARDNLKILHFYVFSAITALYLSPTSFS